MAKSKWGKTILGLAAVGGAIAAGALYLTKKNKCDECEECDVDFEDVQDTAGVLTPVQMGVGPMTITMLLKNTLKSYKKKEGLHD